MDSLRCRRCIKCGQKRAKAAGVDIFEVLLLTEGLSETDLYGHNWVIFFLPQIK